MRVSTRLVDRDLRRRQHGYGSGRRMQIERDRVAWTAGIRYGRTLGSPVAFTVENRDWANWTARMAVEAVPPERRPRPVTRARPGHVDLAGALKYGTDDIREVLERASARSTAVRVVAGSLCAQLLGACGVRIWSFVDQVGPIRAYPDSDDPVRCIPDRWFERDLRSPSPLRCPDPDAEPAMLREIDAAREAGDHHVTGAAELAGEPLRGIVAAAEAPIVVGRHEGDRVDRRPLDGVADQIGREFGERAEAAVFPASDDSPSRLVVGNCRSGAGKREPPARALAAARDRPRRRRPAARAQRPAQTNEALAAGFAELVGGATADEATPREDEVEHLVRR
jgi:hypothetical protein